MLYNVYKQPTKSAVKLLYLLPGKMAAPDTTTAALLGILKEMQEQRRADKEMILRTEQERLQ